MINWVFILHRYLPVSIILLRYFTLIWLQLLGAQNDMQKVRQFAYAQIRNLGMNDIIGPVSFDVSDENEFAVKPYSKKTARIIDEVSGVVSWLHFENVM